MEIQLKPIGFKEGDLVVVNLEAGTRVGWTGIILGFYDGFARVHLTKNVVGDTISDTVDFLALMLDHRKVV